MNKNLRNIAIIAHVDHGKTTLIDKLLQQSGALKSYKETSDRIMDSNDLEKERGITIFSKNAAITWKKYRINIIDTPGHSDFGGEVERILSMVDSVLLVVDALDGPMPQTRFVTQKSFDYGINPIVVINKIDRKNSRPNWVIDQIFELFINLNATDKQLDFPIIYTSALLGTSGIDYKNMGNDMSALYEAMIKYTPSPKTNLKNPFQMQISQLQYDNYLGTIGIGRISQGSITPNKNVTIINNMGLKTFGKIGRVLNYRGLNKIDTNLAQSGDIVAITGISNINISDTICDNSYVQPLPKLKVDKPTVEMMFSTNTSPFSGTEGKHITSRKILNRLKKEIINNISLEIKETENSNIFSISGRGELHLSILIENMRREGFELEVSRPKVIKRNINGIIQEPFNTVMINIKQDHQGLVMKLIGERKGKIIHISTDATNRIKINCILSSRALIGFKSEFITLTSGYGTFDFSFSHYEKVKFENIGHRKSGVLISNKTGFSVGFSLFNLQSRGKLFIKHGEKVYEGQIIGIHNKINDLTVNCLSGKKLTNMRASGSDEAITLTKPLKINLEYAISFINDDELVEVTPSSIRLRKKYLKESERKVALRKQ